MKRTAITAIALVSMFALQGCAAESAAPVKDDVAQSQEETSAETPPQPESADSADEAAESSETPSAPADFFTVEYEDSYKSIFTLDKAQIEEATGAELTESSRSQVAEQLADVELWKQHERSAEYAELIVEAFTRETGSTDEALRAVLSGSGARMKVYVGHTSHKNIAHIEVDHQD